MITPLSIDQPYFIRTTQDYEMAWQSFVKNNQLAYKFLVNPEPNMISEVILNPDKRDMLMENFRTSRNFEIGSLNIWERDRMDDQTWLHNNFL